MPDGAIFLSYARQDLAAVQEMKAGLDAGGLPVWFDMASLEAGDPWRHTIKSCIRNCSCFIPVISRNTEARLEGVFRWEWHCAVERARTIDKSRPFLFPVLIDDTRKFTAIPEEFAESHRTRLPGGQVTPEFVAKMQAIVLRVRAESETRSHRHE
jgi:hypothetical protein